MISLSHPNELILRSSLAVAFYVTISGTIALAQSPQLHQIKNEQPISFTPSSIATNAVGGTTPQTATTKAFAQPFGQQPPDAGESVLLPAGTPTSSTSFPAIVTVNGSRMQLRPNPAGIYPRLTVPANASIGIHLNVSPNTVVQAVVPDGGNVVEKTHISSHIADSNGNIDFTYQVPADAGRHRVIIVKDGRKEIFSFWIGPDLPMKVTAASK